MQKEDQNTTIKKIKKKNKRKIRDPLNIGELVYVLAERLKKKDAPRRLHKNTTENKSFFNNQEIFVIQKIARNTNDKLFYWVSKRNNQKLIIIF